MKRPRNSPSDYQGPGTIETVAAVACLARSKFVRLFAQNMLLASALTRCPQTCLGLWPKWPELAEGTSGASGCVGTTARACPRFLPLCFVLRWLPWSTRESTSDFNCSTSLHHFIVSSLLSSDTTRRVPLIREKKEFHRVFER